MTKRSFACSLPPLSTRFEPNKINRVTSASGDAEASPSSVDPAARPQSLPLTNGDVGLAQVQMALDGLFPLFSCHSCLFSDCFLHFCDHWFFLCHMCRASATTLKAASQGYLSNTDILLVILRATVTQQHKNVPLVDRGQP